MSSTQQLLLGEGAGAPAVYIEDVFSTYLLSWSASTQTVTNGIDLTKGGLVWSKVRSVGTTDHCLNDSARNSFADRLVSNSAAAQNVNFSATEGVTAVSITGFTYRTYSGYGSTYTYATWSFRKQPKFFDIVTYTGNNGSQTINHNLGSTPGCIIVKCATGADDWFVYHSSLGTSKYLKLDLTDTAATSAGFWGSVTSTSFGTTAALNANGQTYVAYLFAHDAGGFGLTGTDNVISCGSYTTDASGNATVNLGWEPQYLTLKNSTGAADQWYTFDSMRGFSYASAKYLFPNLSNAEGDYGANVVYPLATGFQVKGLQTSTTYIYIAIRRGPMKVPTDGTTVFEPKTTNNNAVLGGLMAADMGWFKDRATTANWFVSDRLRGITGGSASYYNPTLYTNLTSAEATPASGDTVASTSYGGTGVTNGNIYFGGAGLSTDKALGYSFKRAPNFFDVVCYTGTGSSPNTQTHNLGVAPELIIVKSRSSAAYNWTVWSSFTGSNFKLQYLNTTAAAGTISYSADYMPSAPTATQVAFGTTTLANDSAVTYVAYLFATCPGVSKVGSYTGTGATQTISCGFTGGARWVMVKRTDTTGDWYVWDTARGMVAGTDPSLLTNSTAAEVNADSIYTTTGGFQIVSTAAGINASGGTYIYMAIA